MTEQSAYVNRFLEALSSDGAASDRAAKMMLYGQFVGSWDLQVVDYEADGKRWEGVGEVHFGWVLEGRAIQDVWISPPRNQRKTISTTRNTYGTTLRVYDPNMAAWHILWMVLSSLRRLISSAYDLTGLHRLSRLPSAGVLVPLLHLQTLRA